MGRHPRIPTSLRRGPFTLTEARQAGLDVWHLKGAAWRRLGPETYAWAGRPNDAGLQLEAALRRLPPMAVFSGVTAAWLHGLDVLPCDPIEVIVPKDAGVSARAGMALRRSTLQRDEVVRVRGKPATSILRTLGDLSRHMSLTEAVVIADMALRAGLVDQAHFCEWTRLRMLLVLAGLPRPAAQVPIHDARGRFLGRPDLYYPASRLGIEYDGGSHRVSLAADNHRQNRLLSGGIQLLRFAAADVLHDGGAVVAQVRGMLAARGAVPPVDVEPRALV